MNRRKSKKYAYVTEFLNDVTNVVYVYNNVIEMRHYTSTTKYMMAGFEHNGGYPRSACKIIGKLLIKEGFTPLSPKEVVVQVSLGLLPEPNIAFNGLGDKLIRGYVRQLW